MKTILSKRKLIGRAERDVLKRAKKEAKKEAEQAEFLKLIKELKLGEEAETLETRPAA